MLTSVSSKSQDNKVLLEARNIRLSIDSQPILRDISLAIKEGEIVALLGPSGCGKTTLLRVIAGLTTTDAGTLLLKGENIGEVPVHKRSRSAS